MEEEAAEARRGNSVRASVDRRKVCALGEFWDTEWDKEAGKKGGGGQWQ